jgi:predicted TIM-barrel fold metal-dependent hydrolase
VFPEAVRPQGSLEVLLRLLDECGIERAVCFAPFANQLEGSGIEGNGWLAKAIRPYGDRLLGFGTIDFAAGDVAGQVARIRELGFRGIKLHPAVQRFHILSAPLMEVYGRAEELGLLLCFHTGVHHARLSDARLIDFDEIAFRFPRLRFSLEHVGGYAFYREAVGVIQNNLGRPHSAAAPGTPGAGGTADAAGTAGTADGTAGSPLKGTVYAGLTSVFSAREPAWYLPPSGPDSIEALVTQVGADHIVFGLDFPYKSPAYIREAIGIVRGLAIPDRDKAQILGGTLRALLGMAP